MIKFKNINIEYSAGRFDSWTLAFFLPPENVLTFDILFSFYQHEETFSANESAENHTKTSEKKQLCIAYKNIL